MKLLLLANPTASRHAPRLLPRLRDWFSRRLPSPEYFEASSEEELCSQARAAAGEGYDAVVAAGGDGTAHAVLNELLGTRTALGIVPLGHGNDLARSFGVPLDPFQAAEFLLQASDVQVDVARAGERVFAGVAGAGFDAETNRRANSWGSWPGGHLRYFAAGLLTLALYRPIGVELVSDGGEFSGEVMWVVVANTPYYGGGLRIAPAARPDDGVLDVCVIERMPRRELLALYPRLRRGKHVQARGVRTFCATTVELRAPAGAIVYGDGERLATLPIRIQVEPRSLRVLACLG